MANARDRALIGRTARLAAALLISVVSCAAGVLGTAVSASAATAAAPTQIVQFSTDGINFSDSYTGQLFEGVQLIPGGSAGRSFYVRNGASQAGILGVTLADLSTDNTEFANGLSISTSTTGAPGAAVPVSLARPCYTLSHGLRLSSGDSVRLDTRISLAALTGTAGQAGSVWFALQVSFSSTDVGAPAPDTCPVNYGTVPTFPNFPGGTTTIRHTPTATSSTTIYRSTVQGWTPSTSIGGGKVTDPTVPTIPGAPSEPLTKTLVSNTARLYQEYDVAFWLAMSVLGVVILVLAHRRRAEDQPEQPVPSRQIGI